MKAFFRLAVLTLVASLGSFAAADSKIPPELPVETFFKNPNFTQLTFSPDGKKIACLIPYNHRMNLAVIDLEKKTKNLLTSFKDNDVGGYLWASDTRLILFQDEDGKESPAVMAVDVDGKNPLLLASRKGGVPFGGFIARKHGDSRRVLVLGNVTVRDVPDVCLMDIANGKMSPIVRNPGHVIDWVLDQQQNVRVAVEMKDFHVRVLLRGPDGKGDWEEVQSHDADAPNWSPLAFDEDGHTLYVASTVDTDRSVIRTFDTRTRQLGPIVAQDPVYDITNVIVDTDRRRVIGARYEAETSRTIWFDPARRELQAKIDASMPGSINRIVRGSPDGTRFLIYAYTASDPGVYYLFDDAKRKIEEVAVVIPGIDPEQMAEVKPIEFTARDGVTLRGYLTLPRGRDPQNLPLVIHPHGGPYGPRDTWAFNPEVQFYANRGFAVLQVNFRGSGGYGDAFGRLGWKRWGLEMQDDLSDGVKWATQQGIADPKRVVISGASYGGYAAMAGLAFTPELYCAGINYVGVTDIEFLLPKAAPPDRVRWYLTRIADLSKPEDRKRVRATSPVHFAERIKAPVLMAYGRNDPRVEIGHGYKMEATLKRAGVPFQFIINDKEGHGFQKEELSIEFYGRVDAFLKQYVPGLNPNVKVGPVETIQMPAKT